MEKREQLAEILGYSCFSKLILEERMAKTPENVQRFEEDLALKLLPKAREELNELIKLKREHVGDENAEMMPWDKAYYGQMQKKKFYDVDEE